jgi:zinc finger CCCH domain-containing protein 13
MGRNHEIVYENRLDDRNFVPDGMVPGLRSTFPSRRESGMFQDPLDELAAFNVQQRIPPQRAVDQIYPVAPIPSIYPNQTNVPRNSGLPVQQPFRNGNSPSATLLHSSPQQRLPPGLANLGGRPPHDPSQFLGSIVGVPSHLQGNGSGQPAYNFSSGTMNYPAGPQVRVPPAVSPNIQNAIDHSHVVSHLHVSKLDVRVPSQAQLLGLNNGAVGTGSRAPGVGFAQQNAQPMHIPHTTMRQQPHIQQQSHPQNLSHLLPQHMQASTGGNTQPAQDLMALLLHGAPRD